MNMFYPILNEAEPKYNSNAVVNRIKLGDLDVVTAPDGSKVNLKRIKDDIKEIKTLIVAQDPLFSPFVYELNTVYTWSVKTMGTDGNWLFINPKWTEKLTFDECTFVIYHELMHCLLDHMKRGRLGDYNHKKFNYAADYEINAVFADLMHEEYNIPELFGGNLSGILYDKKFLNLPAETIYDMIPTPPPDKNDGGFGGDDMGDGGEEGEEGEEGDGNGENSKPGKGKPGKGKPGSGGSLGGQKDPGGQFEAGKMGAADADDARLQREFEKEAGNQPGGMMSPELGKKIAKQAGLGDDEIAKEGNKTADDWTKKSRELLERATKQSGGGAGNMLTKILGNHHNSVINWKQILSRYVGEILAKKDFSWRMPNKRYMAQNPNNIRIRGVQSGREISKIVVCMDTSGSMERKLIQGIIDEINAILRLHKVKEIIVLFFDAEIKSPQVISGNKSAYCPEVIGGGGTDFQVPLDYIKSKYKDQLSLCLFFTDGYEAIPRKPVYADKFIWIVYDNPTWPNSPHVGTNPIFGKRILVNTKSLEKGVKKFVSERVAYYGKLVTESIKKYIK